MSYGVMFTVLDDFRDEFNIAESKLGIIVGIGFLTGFLSQIFFAPLADKGHSKKLVMTGIVIEIVGTLFMAFGHAFLPLLIGRLLTGFGVGISEPALRRILILSDPERMGRNLGLIVSASVAGFTAGPIVSALTADTLGLSAPFLIVAACLLPVMTSFFEWPLSARGAKKIWERNPVKKPIPTMIPSFDSAILNSSRKSSNTVNITP
jgi:MFS family permease